MSLPFRAVIITFAMLTGLITSYSVWSDEVFDRLDGTGPSGKKVDVVEWEGNLEIHAFPKGSLKGLSAKLDDRTEGQKVMVIGYRFDGMKTPLVRRAIMGIPVNKNVKAYIDPTNKEFDKIALTNDSLPKPYIAYKLDPAPLQWYPDGDPRNDATPVNGVQLGGTQDQQQPAAPAHNRRPRPQGDANPSGRKPASVDDDGAIQNFSW